MSAQINKPNLSPRIVTEQQVGLVKVKLDYGQSNKQDREIFGKLIPFNEVWRTGANSSTKITFDQTIQLAENTIPAGTYGLYTIPAKDKWTIIIHKNSALWGKAGYDKANDLIRFQIPVTEIKDTLETFSIYFENFNTNGGDLIISWENTKIKIPLFVDSDKIIFEEINTKINKSTAPVAAQTYFDAAQFYYLKRKDLDTAMIWFDKAIELNPQAFWFLYYKAELALYQENYELAKVTTEKCYAAAKLSPSTDYGYIAKCQLLFKLISDKE
jgi:tetratricopeptide (TPR) repeat protein